ncbi:ABC transporter substrate-binding protein [Oryzibacter oryziterrae]|uniref:ABC transporter substrate-binding protein n=1 Tax=Oryzibacter oryziterrae TaxID=2766474 RepID=UPI001F1FE230|nr:ABC transporter substrate-binding protein [Oryzibacter oryziterrae]
MTIRVKGASIPGALRLMGLAGASSLALVMASDASLAAPKLTLTYMASQEWVKDAEQDLAKKFEEKTGIAIDFQILPSDQYFNVLQTKLNSGEGPDLFGGQSGVTDLKLQYNVEKNAVDLSKEPWASKEDPLVAAQSTVNGKLYGMTYWDIVGNTWVVSYNKKLFAQYGLSVPTTYAEFKADCQKLKDAGVQPLFEPVAPGWHHVLWFLELGPRYEELTPGLADSLNANTATFAGNAAMTSAVTQLKEVFDNGYMGQNALADVYTDASKAMASGKVGMVLANTGFASLVEHDYPDMKASDIGVFLMPLADNQRVNINPAGPTHFIYSGSPNIDAAKQYLDFLAQPENMDYFIDHTPTAMTLPFEGTKTKFSADAQAMFDTHKDARGTVYQTAVTYVNPQWMDIGADLTAMFTGALTPEKVLSNIDKRRADLAKAAKDPAWKK